MNQNEFPYAIKALTLRMIQIGANLIDEQDPDRINKMQNELHELKQAIQVLQKGEQT